VKRKLEESSDERERWRLRTSWRRRVECRRSDGVAAEAEESCWRSTCTDGEREREKKSEWERERVLKLLCI